MYASARLSRLVFAFAVLISLVSVTAAAQSPPPPFTARNTVYFEGGGNALLYSINYERMVVGGLTARVGVAVFPAWFPWVGEGDDGAALVMVPVQAGYVFGTGDHHLEIGAGATFGNASVDIGDLEGREEWVYGSGTVGYRFQRPQGGVVFRATVTPLFIEVLDVGVIPMIGLSLGRSF